MTKFQIDGAVIDLSRGEITVNGDTRTAEPKVMAVLQLLIEAKGEVVTQDEIFSRVWPGSVYSQSLIQRNIAVLRKALGDDAKQQRLIVTHPKRGYSLNFPQHSPLFNLRSRIAKLFAVGLLVLTAVLLVILINHYSQSSAENSLPTIVDMQQISATDALESTPKYVGQRHISFIRAGHTQGSAVWLHDRTTEVEKRLTPYFDNIVSYQWLDNATLVFATQRENSITFHRIVEAVTGNKTTLPENLSLEPVTSLEGVERLRHFQFTDNGQLLYLALKDHKNQLISKHLLSEKERVLLTQTSDFNPYGFSLNNKQKSIAISGFSANMTTEIVLLQSESSFVKPWATLNSDIYQLAWYPNSDMLLMTQGRKILHLEANGKVNELAYSTPKFISQPAISADGSTILLNEQTFDTDLWTTNLSSETPQLLADSTAADYASTYSANGKKVAFISTRKGYPQIYVADLNTQQTRVVYPNPQRKLILSPPVWHPTKNILLTSVNEQLLMIDLQENDITLQSFENTVMEPLDWYLNDEFVLVVDLSSNQSVLSKFNLTDGTVLPLTESRSLGAVLSPKQALLLFDKQSVYKWPQGSVNPVASFEGEIISYLAHSSGLYVLILEEGHSNLYRLDWQNLTKSLINSMPEQVYMLWDIHPDNATLIYETAETRSNIIQLSLSF